MIIDRSVMLSRFYDYFKIDLIRKNVFVILAMLPLLSCQSIAVLKQEQIIQEHQRHDAAIYNTQLGLAYLHRGDKPRAKQKLLKALDLAPDSADVNVAMGYFLEKTGDIVKAKDYYVKALSLLPNDGRQINNYGTFLCRTGHYQEAEERFLKAANDVHYVNSAIAYENAGLCAMMVSDYDKAVFYFKKALLQDPNRKQAREELERIKLKLPHHE